MAERLVLSAWLGRAETMDIDAVIDLAVRPWDIAGAQAILGVFETAMEHASWLMVRCESRWTLAKCADGSVSTISASLADILGLIEDDLRG